MYTATARTPDVAQDSYSNSMRQYRLAAESPGQSPTRQVPSEIAGLNEAIGTLHHAVEELSGKLSPLISPLPEQAENGLGQDSPPMCDVACKIRDAATRVAILANRIMELTGRVEV